MKELEDYFRNKDVASVLDIGTGTGDFLKILRSVFPNSKFVGVDPNKNSLNEAKENYPDVDFKVMGAENLEFPEGEFEMASISMALHHLPDIQISLKEMQRVVKSGGWIIVNELFSDNLNPAQKVHKMFHHFRSNTDRILGRSHNETFKKNEIIKIIKESGIDIHFHFEFEKNINLIADNEDLELRVQKMKDMLESVKGFSEYEILKPQIDEFRKRALEFGLQPATNVVVVGQVK